jgi:protein-L-isoaspartate(D-aspartate) O-methyltransferase
MSWIDEQLVARGIREARVLDAMRRMPRDAFVRRDLVCFAYDDRALAIGEGQTISQPYMVAATTEAQLHGIERVLDVGTGSGYQAAILGVLAREVIGIERVEALASRARETLAALGYRNIEIIVGDGSVGYAPGAPYDGIVVGAAAPRVPMALRDQLADGGRLVIPRRRDSITRSSWSSRATAIDSTSRAAGDACSCDSWVRKHGPVKC